MANEAKIVFTGDTSGAVAAISRLKGELSGVRQLASQALALTGISFGTIEIIKMADQYGQLSARLQLATRYSGDYATVQKSLQQTAADTRTDLTATIDMYSKLSPALQAVGRNSAQSIGIIGTVNKAVALSGVSSETAAAGIMQFVQALGKGSLNGDELNSILENTPGLADAIAEGLGRTRGELKQMGADGKLTADVVVAALEKVSDRVNTDFEKLPVTVGQAMTILQNTLTESIGTAGQATGAMGALARAILLVSDSIKSFSGSDGARWLSEFLIETIDGFSRVVRITGRYIAAWVAAQKVGTKDAQAVWQAFYDDFNEIANEKWQHEQRTEKIVATEKEVAAQRLDIEKKLQTKIAELAQLRAIQEGRVSASILDTDAKRADAQIKNAEKVRVAFAAAWKDNLKDAQAAGEAAKKLFESAAEVRQTGSDKADAKLRSTLPPEQQQADIQNKFNDAASAAETNAGLATIAALHGRLENAAKLSEQAQKDAERAAKFADQIDDPKAGAAAITQASEIQAKLLEAQGKAKEQEQAQFEKQAEISAAKMKELDAMLTEMQAKAASIRVAADVSAAESAIKGLQNQLDGLQDETVTVTINQVNAPGTINTVGSSDAPIPGRAFGGPLPGRAPHDRADNMLYWGTPGEWVIQRPAVRHYGSAFISALNSMRLPKFANGGALGGLRLPSLSASKSAASSSTTPVNLYLDGQRVQVQGTADAAQQLTTMIKRQALKKGGHR